MMNVLENIREPQLVTEIIFDIISGNFPRAEIKIISDGRQRRLK